MSTYPAGSGVTLYTGRFGADGYHKDGKVHSAAADFELAGTARTLCGRTLPSIATVFAPDAWQSITVAGACTRCARVRVEIDPPTVKSSGKAARTFGYRYTEARAAAALALGTDDLELGGINVELRIYYFRAAA